MRYAHTNIITKDWKLLADFYIQVFNCEIIPPIRNQSGEWLDRGVGINNARLKGAHLRLPGHGENGPTLEIYQYEEMLEQGPFMPNQRGFGHIAFEVDDVETVLQEIISFGGSIFGEVTRRNIEGVGELCFVYARDLDGNLIEIQSWN